MSKHQLTIAFLPASNNGLSFRGSEVALYDYADNLETMLGHKSIICLGRNAFNEPIVLKIFEKRFPIIIYFNDEQDLERQLTERQVSALYTIRASPTRGLYLRKIPMFIHCVYEMDPLPEISDSKTICAGVSETVASRAKDPNRRIFVPHMISLDNTTENYRQTLNIPENAIVFGRHGGADTWDLEFAKNALLKVLESHNNIYFLFAVRPTILQNIAHPRIICLKPFADRKTKRKFINTCNYMFHGQSLGETFGLSIGEMITAGKPIIVWNGGVAREHLRILAGKCFLYNNKEELYRLLTTLNPEITNKLNWKSYEEYTPEKVMNKFEKVFLGDIHR